MQEKHLKHTLKISKYLRMITHQKSRVTPMITPDERNRTSDRLDSGCLTTESYALQNEPKRNQGNPAASTRLARQKGIEVDETKIETI
ncbi:hypothetical protein GUJ93_ZPchr0012g20924 [Zizania palustris]|uniref:Uncharacterized protein n=1 Tax=Zizania palustris TaxID=103762 RepID=A0A8J5WU64_ZIZPA|nr:hypothetical protein GUJ93_ZPchr0012g20924 [Zizania palustris]